MFCPKCEAECRDGFSWVRPLAEPGRLMIRTFQLYLGQDILKDWGLSYMGINLDCNK